MNAAPDEASSCDGVAEARTTPSPKYAPRVAVIILNWNGKDDTLECLASVQQIAYPNLETIVVDNGSRDDSVEAFRQRFPAISVIATSENLGYAGGNNVGLRHALANNTDYVLLLNNDTIVDPNIIVAFIAATAAAPGGGMFAAKIYYHAEPRKLWYAGAYLEKRLHSIHIGEGQVDNGNDYSSMVETEFASGCALFVKTSVVREIGLLDERFFLFYEEVDWCYRAKRAGHKSFLVPEAKVWHKASASFGGERSALARYFVKRNSLLFARKHLPLGKRLSVCADSIAELAEDMWDFRPRFAFARDEGQSRVQAFYWSLLSYGRAMRRMYHDQPRFLAHLWGVRDFLLGHFGNCPEAVRSLGKKDPHRGPVVKDASSATR